MIKSRIREILYCDDTEEQRYAMRRILEGAGYTVVEAVTGTEALEKLHSGLLAAVLDVKLPDISGYEVCRRIKGNPATAAIPVLQISASFADPALRAQGLQGGADAYVAQPVHSAELLALVGALIRSHESERTIRFQAEVSRQLAHSLDQNETLSAIERVFVPRFADRCYAVLREGALASGRRHAAARDSYADPAGARVLDGETRLPNGLREVVSEVSHRSQAMLIPAGTVIPMSAPVPTPQLSPSDYILAPLAVGRRQLGTLVFCVDGMDRQYQVANLPLAQDLADRAALALQNATLYTAQLAAQEALVQSEKLAAAGRLSAAIAHEINNPLESITNLMYLIETSDEISPTIKSYVQEALSELSRLTHIARQSLGFYRELTGPQVFDLNESVDDTLNIYMKRFQAKHIKVDRCYAPGPLTLCAVKGEVRQVVSNLLVNAYDALPEDGTLRIETELLSSANGDLASYRKVAFRVIDRGPGIPPETLSRVFEPFFTTKQGTGTGLGLWVSNTIVTKHGGTIEVETKTEGPDRGTTFEVVLPVNCPEEPGVGNRV
jgi:signal transduction histidine kinase